MFLVRQKRFKQTVQTVLKILILTFFISFIASNVFSFGFLLFVEFIQSRKAVSSLLCCYRTPETSGSPLPSLFLALLHKISFFKTISVSYLVWKEISFSVKVHLYSPSMSCFFLSPVLCFFLTPLSLWGTAVFLRSQVVNRGGIQFQGRSLIGWFEKFGWFFYPLSLSPSSFFLSFPHPPTYSPSRQEELGDEKNNFFLTHTCFLLLSSFSVSHSSKARQNGMHLLDSDGQHMACGCEEEFWVPALTGRGCLASYSNLNVLMV